MNNKKKKLEGFSLAEIVLSIGLFAVMSSFLIFLMVDATRAYENIAKRTNAANLTKDIYSALKFVKSEEWFKISKETGGGEKHLEFVDGTYNITNGPGLQNSLNYFFTVSHTYRDNLGQIVTEGGTLDPHTRTIDINIQWRDRLGKLYTLTPKLFLNDWNINSVVFTSKADFDLGTYTDTLAQETYGGEVRLAPQRYFDWCRPSLSTYAFDLPGQGVAKTISSNGNTIYMGTGDNASGLSFVKATVTEDVNGEPLVTINGSVDLGKTNDIQALTNGYVLVGSDTNSKEVSIISTQTTPFQEVGWYDLSGNVDGQHVAGYGNIGFVSYRNNVTLFDITEKTGSRSTLRSVSVGGGGALVTDLYVDESFMYVTVSGDTYNLKVYTYSPTITLIGKANLGSVTPTALFVSLDKNRAYVGTSANAGHEFYVLDISNKYTQYPLIFSYELGTLSVRSITAVEDRAMIGGEGGYGNPDYIVLDISTGTSATQCGQLSISTSINSMDLVILGEHLYTYVLTADSANELKVIEGGNGGGGEDGYGYLPSGQYLSRILDTTSETATFYTLTLETEIPTGSELRIQLRTSSSITMNDSTWVGPDNTSGTYYSTSGIYYLTTPLHGRYFQYKADFISNTDTTPLLKELSISYEK